VRINAQLIDVSTDEHLWAQTFDREMTVENIFDIQSDITRHIVEAVRGTLTDSEESDLQQLPTTNLQAYEAWLKARIALNRPEYSADKYIEAEKWLKKAVELDPQFAQAWAQLVVTNGQAIWIGYDDTPERLAAMRNALDQARKTGPDLPETLAAEAEYLYRIDTDFHAAEPLFAKASEARPGDADLLIRLAMTERRTAHFEDAIAHIEKAAELDPANTYARALEAETLAIMKDWQRLEPLLAQWRKQFPEVEAFSAYQVWAEVFAHGDLAGARQILDTLKPSLAPAYQNIAFVVPLFERDYQGLIDHWNEPPLVQLRDNPSLSAIWLEQIARAYKYMGDETNCRVFADRAIEAGKKYTSPSVNSAAFILNALAQAYADNGQYDLALKTIDQARELMPEANDSLEGPLLSVARAKMLGLAGQREAALMEIKRLLHTPGGPTVWGLRLNPDWDYFRDDPEFQKLSGKAGQQEEHSS